MVESYPHLKLQRESRENVKRSGQRPRFTVPDDTRAHARRLSQELVEASEQRVGDVGGFDARRLFRFTVQKGFNPDDLRKISSEIEFVSQENETVVIVFVSDAALDQFEASLASMAQGVKVTNRHVIYALLGVAGWKPEDRKGWALKKFDFPASDTFLLDVELWPLEDHPQKRIQECEAFEAWMNLNGIYKKDQIKQPGLTLYRVECNDIQSQLLLQHRDIRSVDLPPSFGFERSLVFQDIAKFPDISPPGEQAPGVVVLDSGIATGHPLLGAAVGDSQSFLPGEESAADETGHGTHVAGLALYGDFENSLRTGLFVPSLRLFGGRILDRNNENNTGFIENHIDKAVRYFVNEYNCRVFNLSYGDSKKPFLGGHLKGLSFTLDSLSRELGVLFVVSAGNHWIDEDSPQGLTWKNHYPEYLLNDGWRIVEPAPALNVLTVGSLARHNQTYNSQRYPLDPSEIPIAQPNQPSPFTRSGPSVDGAIKPELMAYGGNWAVNARGGNAIPDRLAGLGIVSTGYSFATGNPFVVDSGTSMAAPQVAHLAASILREHPDASANLLRALLCAHAVVPEESQTLINHNKMLKKVCGYGQVDVTALHRSLDSAVTLIAEGRIVNKSHHFYEIPIPNEFTSDGKRLREISVALAYTPVVRTTRIKYRATRIDFRLVTESGLDQVAKMFNKATDEKEYENIKETDSSHRMIGSFKRGKGTVQADKWHFDKFISTSSLRKKKLFIVVTRNDFPWGEPLCATEEEYALVVCLSDRKNEEARLYTEIKNQLQARIRGRVKG
ncbi:MAG: S8 family peptidase [Magnetococcales bacterium]|nr:S8 family peptidase [Magnetococcales bacterium]